MDCAVFPWLAQFGYQGKRRRLEGADEGLEFGLREGANISSLPKLVFHNFIVNFRMLKDRWVIRGNKSSRYAKDANIKAINKTMVQGWVSLEEVERHEPLEPHVQVVRGERVRFSVKEDIAGLCAQTCHSLSTCAWCGVWSLNIQPGSGN